MAETSTFTNITAEMPIIGFTGALGSGCTYFARGLEEYHGYLYCSLSRPIHKALKSKNLPPTSKNLQNMGNRLRAEDGLDCLVATALKEVDQEIGQRKDSSPKGLVVDGIRNAAEIDALRTWPQFFLISVQARQQLREQRVLRSGKRCKTKEEFSAADTRDADEQKVNGQQVRRCNYLADIIVLNEEEISGDAKLNRQRYINENIYDRYVMLIEHLAQGRQPKENRARNDETLMTVAYVLSKRSSCLKRKVGAVIASDRGDIIAAGYNDVPEPMTPCIEDASLGRCARDVFQETIGQNIKHCPNCGKEIEIREKCAKCKSEIDRFVKRCPECGEELGIEYDCQECKTNVLPAFLPGGDEKSGKLLGMCRALHAEENAVLSLSRNGIVPPDGTVLYSTTFPCNLCANKIVTLGIKSVVFAEPYPILEARNVFREKNVQLRRFEGVKSNAYFRMYS